MSVDVTEQVVIERPIDEVAAYVMDPANEPEWMPAIAESRPLTDGPMAPGTKVRRVAKFLGRRFSYTPEVIAYEPPSLLVMRADRPFEMDITYRLEAVSRGTRMSVRLAGGGSGFFRLAGPLLAASVRRSIRGDLRRLRDLVRSRPAATARD